MKQDFRGFKTTISRSSWVLLLMFLGLQASATRLKGKIIDKEGYPVSFASIAVKGTTIATSAGEEGEYFVDLPEGEATIIVRSMSYKTITKTLRITGETMTQDFSLEDESTTMEEHVVKANARDPAYAIMKKVIDNKRKNSKKTKTFETDIYLKGKLYIRSIPKTLMGKTLTRENKEDIQASLNLDTASNGIVYMLEQMTHYYYKAPNKEFNRIIAVKTSGDPKGLGFAQMPAIVDIYDNNIQVLGGINERGFISPANDNAFYYYNFKYLGSTFEDGLEIDKISFWPKRQLEPTFRGTLYVAEDQWMFQQVELILDKKAQISNVDTLTLKQTYRKSEANTWIIQQQILSPVIKIFGFDIAGDFLTNYTQPKVNQDIADSIFNTKTISVYDSEALSKKANYWEETRPVEVTKEEKANYQFKDSVFIASEQRKDSLFNTGIFNANPISILITGASYKKRNNKIGIEPLINTVSFNTVEGLVLGLTPYWKHKTVEGNLLDVSVSSHYGLANKAVQALFSGSYTWVDSSFIGRTKTVWLKGGRDVFQLNNQNPIPSFYNAWTSLFYGFNYMKLYQANKIQVGYEQNLGTGFRYDINLNYEDRKTLINHSNYTFTAKDALNYTNNELGWLGPLDPQKALVLKIGLKYQPGWRFIEYPNYKMGTSSNAPVFSLEYAKAIPNILGSEIDFDKWLIALDHQWNTGLTGSIDYRLEGGGFLSKGKVGIPDYLHFMGNQTSIAQSSLNSFQTMPYYAYSAFPNLFAQAHAAWHLNGWLTNKIPGFRRLNWNLVLTGNAMAMDNTNYYTEYGVGLENIGWKLFRFIRVDVFAGKGNLTPTWKYKFIVGTTIPLAALNGGK